MEGWVNQFLDWVPIGGVYYTLLGLLAFLESLAFVGLLFPGSVLIVFTGFLAANGKGDFTILATAYTLGAFSGDILSYVIGARAGERLMLRPWFQKRAGLLKKAEDYFVAHGGKSVFIGRFVGFLRPFIPFIAGSARMKALPFTLYALVSGILWGISYPGLGYVCGASWQMVQVWSGRFSLLILVLATLFIVNALFWRYAVPWLGKLGRAAGRKLGELWQQFIATPTVRTFAGQHPRLWSFLRERFSLEHGGGLSLTIGFLVSLLFALLFAWFGRGSHPGSPFIRLDQRVYDLLAVLHHPLTDAFFAAITFLGSGEVMIILGALVLLVLILNNRDFTAVVFVVGLAGGELLNSIVKAIFNRPRPLPHFPQLDIIGASFPSGHAFTALLFYGLVVYFLLGTVRQWHARIVLVLGGSFVTILIGFSRILLGVHWLSDILGGFALAALWLTFLITACETRYRYGGFPLRRGWRPFKLSDRVRFLLLAPVVIAAICTVYLTVAPRLRTISLERAPRPVHELALPALSGEMPADLPLAIETFTGQPQRPLSLVLIADEATLLQQLEAAGWRPARASGFRSFLSTLADIVRDRPLTEGAIVPHLVEGRIQDRNMVHPDSDNLATASRTLLLWDLGRRYPDGRNLWGLLASRQIGMRHYLGLPVPIPLLDINVDRERDALLTSLDIKPLRTLYAPRIPAAGRNATHPWVSDEKIPVAELPTSAP